MENRLTEFTIKIITVVESLPDSKVCNYLGGQLLRSGSSPVLNYGEAQAAESRKDFIHKLKIILKELRETSICLTLLNRKSIIDDASLLKESKELIAIFAKSIATAQANYPTKNKLLHFALIVLHLAV
ncbi:MAG TPA: four helix bundle protein [Chryseolinea sp.]|nr:four helix bundle protein [Chryseolinea sp.]